jgi:hypothetical protein
VGATGSISMSWSILLSHIDKEGIDHADEVVSWVQEDSREGE